MTTYLFSFNYEDLKVNSSDQVQIIMLSVVRNHKVSVWVVAYYKARNIRLSSVINLSINKLSRSEKPHSNT